MNWPSAAGRERERKAKIIETCVILDRVEATNTILSILDDPHICVRSEIAYSELDHSTTNQEPAPLRAA